MDNSLKLNKLEAVFFILIIIINKIILNLPKNLILSCSTGSILNLIYLAIISIFILFLVLKFFKPFSNADILDLSEFLSGKTFKCIIGFLYILLFFFASSFVLINFINILENIYFPLSPRLLILLFFIVPAFIGNLIGGKGISKTNCIIIPAIIFSLILIFLGTSESFELTNLFPILGNGAKSIFLDGFTNIYAFSGIAYIFFLKPMLKNEKDFNKISYLTFGISTLFLILSVTSLLLTFPTITSSQEINSIYAISRVIQFGSFLERLDAIFILLWILSVMSYVSISMYLCIRIIQKLFNLKFSKNLSYLFATFYLAFCNIPFNAANINFFQTTIYKYYLIFLVYIASTFILYFSFLKLKKHNTRSFYEK